MNTFKNFHWNVKLACLSGFLSAISTSLFFDTVMTIFIFNEIAKPVKGEGSENTFLGLIEATYGLSELIFAIPMGYVADKFTRTLVLKIGGGLEYVTLVATSLVIWSIGKWNNSSIPFGLMLVIQCLWGLSWGLSSGASGALVADSVRDGERSQMYLVQSTCALVGSLVGPILIIILARVLSDNTDFWDTETLRTIIYIGMLMHTVPVACMFMYTEITNPEETPYIETPNNDIEQRLLNVESRLQNIHNPTPLVTKPTSFFTFAPTVLFSCQLVISFGSGMTVKYWPMFLKDDCGMSMETIQILALIIITQIIIFQQLAQKISKIIGRVYTAVALNSIGICCQISIALLPKSYYHTTWLVGILYTSRVSIMNSSGPLLSSALMDIVPKDHRARWESLYSIMTLGWCGSALFGGFISDEADYSSTFLITAGCHIVGNSMYLLVRNHIPNE